MGVSGLAALSSSLSAAVAFNERTIPDELLTVVPIPSYASVRSIPLLTIKGSVSLRVDEASGEGVPPHEAAAILEALIASRGVAGGAMSPFMCEWHHIETAFVSAAVGVDTSSISTQQRLMLPLLLDTAFKLPCLTDDGTHMTKDEFVAALQARGW